MAKAKELRLGLVCYGGSSLCIYMHGITKEINRLVSASVSRTNGHPAQTPTERVYGELLDRLADAGPDGTDLRVVVDVIAGTSAGGINGIFLGKALAGNRSQDALRELWFDRGDMNELVIGWRRFLGFPLSWKAKALYLLQRALKRSPLRGDDMARWLHGALATMDESRPNGDAPASLMPTGHPLDLWVTITDFYGYQRLIPLARPEFAPDSRHRHALNFHYSGNGDSEFDDNAGLTFAARTTSCFPAVFPPVNPAALSEAIGAPLDALLSRCFRIYELSGADPNATYFVDGGVLDNKPFGWAIDTIIHSRPAESEVDRRLLYIEPDPGGLATRQGGADPQTLAAALGALTGIPRAEPILDDLLDVQEHNERVERIRDVIEANFARVGALIEPLVPADLLAASAPGEWPWSTWSSKIHELALENAGMAYSTYMRLKISGVLDGFAQSICGICNYPADSNHGYLVRQAVHCWGRRHGLYRGMERQASNGNAPASPFEPTNDQVKFLQAFDLGFMRRRLRFLIAAFNWWYRCAGVEGFPSREQLDEGKSLLYGNIAELDALAGLQVPDPAAGELRTLVQSTFPTDRLTEFLAAHGADGERYAQEYTDALDRLLAQAQSYFGGAVHDFAPALIDQLTPITTTWSAERRRDLVVRYLGFPIWDVLLYPIQALSQVGEGDHIDVIRVSPHEATLLPVPEGGKVEGTRVHHFYAFFSRKARENDYLWGRLDAAEQLVRLLLESAGSDEPLGAWCKRAFEAVLDEEKAALAEIPKTVSGLRASVEALAS
jgi:patatin-related protein